MKYFKRILLMSFSAFALLGAGAFAAVDLLPNLTPLPAKDLRLVTKADGHTYLQLSATNWNRGAGPLELVAGEVDSANNSQKVYQRIYSNEGFRNELAGSFIWHEAHNHFHFDDFAKYILQPVDAPGGSQRESVKTTFCVMDTDRVNTRLPGAPKFAAYTTCSNTKQGMSVGWGDTYKYYLAGQEIDVTGLPDGDYSLRIETDPKNLILETDETDNVSSILIRLANGRVKALR